MRDLLREVGILSSLSTEELHEVSAFFHFFSYERGEVIFREGDQGEELYIVGQGAVRSTIRLGDGSLHEVALFRVGEFFGEMSLLEKAPRSATCQAQEPTVLFVLRGADFYRLMEERPTICIKIMTRMLDNTAERFIQSSGFLSDMVRWGEDARRRAVTDALTGLFNRRFLEESLRDRLEKASSDAQPVSLILMDLDHFREINEVHGAEAGDLAIKTLVPVLRSVLRPDDVPARLAGDEFAILLPNASPEQAIELAEAIGCGIRSLELPEALGGPSHRLTMSQGIASFPRHASDPASLWEKADQALYRAKKAGRDRASFPG